jgi:WD40 repeat protein
MLFGIPPHAPLHLLEAVAMRSRALALLAVFLLVLGAQAQAPVKPKTDFLGDLLPEGAVARIGTLRFKHNPAHGSTVDTAIFTPDGTKIVSLSQDYESVRLWDAASGKDIPGPWSATDKRGFTNRRFSAVAFAPDGARMALAASNGYFGNGQVVRGEIIVYDIAPGKAVKTIAGVKHHVRALAFADGGKTLVSAGEGAVYWWDVDGGKEKRSWTAFADDKTATKDGGTKTFVNCTLASDAKSLAVEVAWRYPQNLVNGVPNRNQGAQEAVGFNLDTGKMTLPGKMTWRAPVSRSPSMRYYHLANGIVITGQTSRLAFSANGKRVAVPVDSNKVEVRDAVTGKLVSAPVQAKGLTGNILGLALSSDGSQVALAGGDGNVVLCDVASAAAPEGAATPAKAPRKLMTRAALYRPYRRCLDFSPDGKRLVIGADADIQVYDVATLQEVLPCEGHRGWIDYVQFAADGKTLLTGGGKNNILPLELATWDTATWKRLQVTSLLAPPWPNVGIVSPEQSAYADKSGTALFDLKTGKLLARLNVPKGPQMQDQGYFSPSGKLYLWGGQVEKGKSSDRLFAVSSGKLLCELPPRAMSYQAVAATFSPDERLVAILGRDKLIHVCETATGKVLQRLESGWTETPQFGGDYSMANFAFSPDGKHLATWVVNIYEGDAWRKPIRVWDVATGKELLQIVSETSNPQGRYYYDRFVRFAWSPDGRILAAGQDKIRLWELATLGVRRVLPGHGDATVQSLAFSPNGRFLASGGTDTTVLIWDTSISGPAGSAAPRAAAVAPVDLEKRWQTLAEDDAAKGYAAMRDLVAAPAESVDWIKARIKPVAPANPKRVRELIAQLDDEQFRVRQKATTELMQVGEHLVPAIDKALAGKPALETSQRLQNLRKRLTSLVIKGPRLQTFRAVEVLEHIGTPEARQVLQELAGGAPGAMVTTQAQGALARLGR